MDASKVQFISRKLIKPSSPTPSHLKSYNLSLLDQLTTPMFIPIALFFTNIESSNDPIQIPQILEKSLSDLLTLYYPFAGTLKNNVSIDCNDEGATFLEVNVQSPMSEILADNDASSHDVVFPSGLPWSSPNEGDSLLMIQLTHFACGGKALSLCLSHKAADGCSATQFLKDWSVTARRRQSGEQKPSPASPLFLGASLFPPETTDPPPVSLNVVREKGTISKRFRFNAESIARLKAAILVSAGNSGLQNPTKVEAVTALLYKSAMAANMKNSAAFHPSNLAFVANLRPLSTPPLLPETVGNFYYFLDASILNEKEMDLCRLVGELRRVKVELGEKCRKLEPNQLLSVALESDEKMELLLERDMYICTSFCRFPAYGLDFGWGRPAKVVFGGRHSRNVFMLMDDESGDGVEALVALDEKVMSIFEINEDILAFSSLN